MYRNHGGRAQTQFQHRRGVWGLGGTRPGAHPAPSQVKEPSRFWQYCASLQGGVSATHSSTSGTQQHRCEAQSPHCLQDAPRPGLAREEVTSMRRLVCTAVLRGLGGQGWGQGMLRATREGPPEGPVAPAPCTGPTLGRGATMSPLRVGHEACGRGPW